MKSEALIHLHQVSRTSQVVGVSEFQILPGENWAVIGGNGSGKSTFASMLAGKISPDDSWRTSKLDKVIMVSFEQEQRLLEKEIYEDNSEWTNKVDHGRTAYELIHEDLEAGVDLPDIIETMQLQAFLNTGFRILSTGERRRLMIARALVQAPQMLVLDEPYDGLDHAFVSHLKEVITDLSQQIPVVIIVNRMSHLGADISHLACLHNMELVLAGPREEVETSSLWNQLQAIHSKPRALPSALRNEVILDIKPGQAVIEMCAVNVGYHNKQIIHDLDWKVMPAEHWRISGPNGSGKSTLVNLISGDHPQCYGNEIYILGHKRGQGESIWDIKQNMGIMSTALHQQYRVAADCENVLLSGFFDSIGVYASVTAEQRIIATEWLTFIGLEKHANSQFRNLSFGQQRMILIARALIKRPPLLLLDEPCQGLDPINRALVLQLITQIADLGIAQIIYISHDKEDHLPCLTHELQFVARDCSNDPSTPAYEIDQHTLNNN